MDTRVVGWRYDLFKHERGLGRNCEEDVASVLQGDGCLIEQ